MTKSTITRERLEQLADNNTICKVSWDERIELAKIALAAMGSETAIADCDPEVYEKGVSVCLVAIPKETAEVICQNITAATGCKVDWHYFGGRVHIKALRESSQSAPVVPDAYVRDESGRMMLNGVCEPKIGFGTGWNACRAAMLQDDEIKTDIRRAVIPPMTIQKSAFLQHAEKLATDVKELAERVQRNDVKALATSEEQRQLRDLVMMVKMLCRTLRKYNPESQQAENFTAYLQKEGLISAADCLRDSDPLDTESEDRRG